MAPEGVYALRRHPQAQEFRAAWEAALALGVQRLEDVAMERAIEGVEVPVLSAGKHFGTRRHYNDALLMFLLRNRAPRRFGENGRMNLADGAHIANLKRQWRAEWERDAFGAEQEVLDSIDAFIDTMRANREASLGPRARAARDEYERIAREEGTSWMLEHAPAPEDAGAETGDAAEADGEPPLALPEPDKRAGD